MQTQYKHYNIVEPTEPHADVTLLLYRGDDGDRFSEELPMTAAMMKENRARIKKAMKALEEAFEG